MVLFMFDKLKFILKLPIVYSIYFISGFVPRRKDIWVFGGFKGVFRDNSRYLYQYINENPKLGIRAIWISNNPESIQEAYLFGEAYHRYSLKGLYYSLIAKVCIFSHYAYDVSFFLSRNSIKVNLWHGIPLKKIEFDATTKPLVDVFAKANLFSKITNHGARIKCDFVLSPSHYVAEYSFKSAFRVQDENIIIAQYPRVSYLMDCEPLEEYKNYHKVFLYMPTWRDDELNFLEQAKFDFDQLNDLMKKNNSVFLIKLHFVTNIHMDLSVYDCIKLLPNNLDPMRLIKTADCLITDYSSVFFDYLVLDKPIIYFCFDLDNYTKTNRELYFSYDEVLAGLRVENYKEFYNSLIDFLDGKDDGKNQRYEIKNRFLNQEFGNKKIIEEIQRKIV